MPGAPRFLARAGGASERGSLPDTEVVHFLPGAFRVDGPAKAGNDIPPKSVLEIAADDENHAAKPRADGVENRIVEQRSARAHRLDLFQPRRVAGRCVRVVTAAHPGSQNHKRRSPRSHPVSDSRKIFREKREVRRDRSLSFVTTAAILRGETRRMRAEILRGNVRIQRLSQQEIHKSILIEVDLPGLKQLVMGTRRVHP